jgi:hypothetical protein
MKCDQSEKWTGIHYKGESYIRFPRACILCETLSVCLNKFTPVMT